MGEKECQRCQNLDLKALNNSGRVLSASLEEIRERSLNGCCGCKLLANAVAYYSSRWLYLRTDEDKKVTVTVDTLLSPLKFRVSVRWPSMNDTENHIYLQILAESNGDIPFDGFDTAHLPAPSPATSECLSSIKNWLTSCDANHRDCKPGISSPFQKPRRLLKLESGESNPLVKLVETQRKDFVYTALSHCWGTTNIPKTTSKCVDQYVSEGLPISILTKTFRDAVNLTLRLQVQYIWIDSLCIVQDDREEWMNECPKMGDIYGGAYLVIAATLAEDGALGFYSDRPPYYRFRFETSDGFCVKAIVREYIRHDSLDFATLFGTQPILPLLTRAWTLQEHLLATRIVHFMPAEVIWECRSSVECECRDFQSPSGPTVYFGSGKRFKSRYDEVVRYGDRSEKLKFWTGIAIQYSARKITYPSDRLPALSSIARNFDKTEELGQYFAGLWEKSLPEGLLWSSMYSLEEDKDKKTHWRDSACVIPTWSWLSVEGRVRFASTKMKVTPLTLSRASYILESDDLYGPVSQASLNISGIVVEVNIAFNEKPQHRLLNSTNSIRRPDTADSVGVKFDTNPFEFSPGDLEGRKIVVLQVAHSDEWALSGAEWHCITMKLVENTPNTYTRLGVSRCPDGWFKGKNQEFLILI